MEYVCADIHVAKVQPRTTKTKLRDSFTEQTREISFSMTTTANSTFQHSNPTAAKSNLILIFAQQVFVGTVPRYLYETW